MKNEQPRKAHHTIGSFTRQVLSRHRRVLQLSLRPRQRYQQERIAIISQIQVPRGRFSHISLICQFFFFLIRNTRASSLEFCFLQTRTVMCTAIFGRATSDKIMGGLSQEDVEAFLHVTMVAIALIGFLQQFRDQEMTHHTR